MVRLLLVRRISPMFARLLLSEWFGLLLTGLLLLCVGMAVHDDRASSISEQILAYGSVALLSVWLLAKGLSWWHAGRRRSAEARGDGHDA
jgi:hypothetical protein